MPVIKEAMLTHEEPACPTGTRRWWVGAAGRHVAPDEHVSGPELNP